MTRSVAAMLAWAPVVPMSAGDGWRLDELEDRECRFPILSEQRQHLFCAAAVDDWLPGEVNGSYCAFHRAFLARQPRVTEDGP